MKLYTTFCVFAFCAFSFANIAEIRNKSVQTISNAQDLKDDILGLRTMDSSYIDVISTLSQLKATVNELDNLIHTKVCSFTPMAQVWNVSGRCGSVRINERWTIRSSGTNNVSTSTGHRGTITYRPANQAMIAQMPSHTTGSFTKVLAWYNRTAFDVSPFGNCNLRFRKAR